MDGTEAEEDGSSAVPPARILRNKTLVGGYILVVSGLDAATAVFLLEMKFYRQPLLCFIGFAFLSFGGIKRVRPYFSSSYSDLGMNLDIPE